MTGHEFKAIREGSGLTFHQLASILRIKDVRTLRRFEDGEHPVSGPVAIVMEMIGRGELPERYYGVGGDDEQGR